MARVHYPTNAGQAWARREAIGGDARLASEVPILLKSRPQSTAWAQCRPRQRPQLPAAARGHGEGEASSPPTAYNSLAVVCGSAQIRPLPPPALRQGRGSARTWPASAASLISLNRERKLSDREYRTKVV
jgi:hypothetical protein